MEEFDISSIVESITDSISNSNGTAGTNQFINNSRENVTVKAYTGSDVIVNTADNASINADDRNQGTDTDNDIIISKGNGDGTKGVISGDGGNDTLFNGYKYNDGKVTSVDGGLRVKVWGGGGNDLIYNVASQVSIMGQGGQDTIVNYGDNVYFNNSEENNYGGNGYPGTGANSLVNYGSTVTIEGYTGNDTINNYGANVLIMSNNGNDTITNYGSKVTINGNGGADSIINYAEGGVLYQFDEDNGNDTIIGLKSADTIIIPGESFSPSEDGNNIIIAQNKTTINLVGAKDIIDNVHFMYTKKYDNNANNIDNTTADLVINALNGNDTIKNSAQNVLINAGGDTDSIKNISDNVTIDGGNQNDTIENNGRKVSIEGGANDDSIINSGNNVTISGSRGNDSIENTGDGLAYVYNVSGNKTITGFSDTDTLVLASVIIKSSVKGDDGNTTIALSNNDSIILEDYALSQVNTVSSLADIQVFYYDKSDEDNTSVTGIDEENSYLKTTGNNTSITGGALNDQIYVLGSQTKINGNAGDDLISLASDSKNNIIEYTAGEGNDTIIGFDGTSTLKVLDGSIGNVNFSETGASLTVGSNTLTFDYFNGANVITVVDAEGNLRRLAMPVTLANYTSDTPITTGDENDSISNSGTNVTINSGAGNDTINNHGASTTIDASTGEDFLINGEYYFQSGFGVSINGGAGNDTISSHGKSLSADGGDGDDLILNGFSQYRFGSETTDYFYDSLSSGESGGDDSTVTGGIGNDTIANHGTSASIDGGIGTDLIYNGYHYNTDSAPAYFSAIENYKGDKSTIVGGEDSDTIFNCGDNVAIGGDEDNDLIVNGEYFYKGGKAVSINGGAGNDTIISQGVSSTLEGVSGNNLIYNGYSYYDNQGDTRYKTAYSSSVAGYNGDNSTIIGGDAADSIVNNGSYVSINSGEGANSILSVGDFVTIKTGTGNNTISSTGKNVSITANTGKDYIFLESNSNFTTVDGGGDKDYISGKGTSVSINGGAGNDIIRATLLSSSISGGAGDDYIYSFGTGNLIEYKVGDGKDSIMNLSSSDTISIAGSSYASAISGNNLVLNVDDENSLTIVNAAKLSSINIEGTLSNESNTYLVNNKAESPLTITSDIQNAICFGRTTAIKITGNTLDNSIVGGIRNDTIDGAAGDDTLTGGNGSDIFVYSGGNDVIADYTTGDKISLSGASITGVSIVEIKDVSLKMSNGGSLTIIDGYKNKNKNKLITFQEEKKSKAYVFEEDQIFNRNKSEITLTAATTAFDASTKQYSKIKTINASLISDAISIQGNNNANKIYVGDKGSTLNGGKGNDTLWGGDGVDIFVYENKYGNDVIYNYTEGSDTISLTGGATIKNVTTKKSGEVIFKVGSKKLTVKDSLNKEITFSEDGTVKKYSGGIIYNSDKTSATLTSAYTTKGAIKLGVTTLDASLVKKGVNISGSGTILGSIKMDTISGNAGNDYLSGDKGSDEIHGGYGDDTLIGGKGNDTLWGENGADTFVYNKGDGKDVIIGFENNDLLQITGGFYPYYDAEDKEISIKVGSTKNAITLKNFGTTNQFTINDETWKISKSGIYRSV